MIYAAILGFGTVGSGVADVLTDNADSVARGAGQEIVLKRIVDIRDFPGNRYEPLLTHDFNDVLNDPDISIVAETIGGKGIAYEFTKSLLSAGKSVITSNKELVAAHGAELLALAAENKCRYMFEASVGGGIPVITPFARSLAANHITEVAGILNGTTNYILTRMIDDGISFADALAEAQAKGYAEQNPTADVDGHDACRKICILASLACGSHIYPELVSTRGIRDIADDDALAAASGGYKIKLLGRAVRSSAGSFGIFVEPHLVPDSHPLACADDVFNAIMVTGDAVGDVMFYGRGAGKLATASAVTADIIDAARDPHGMFSFGWDPEKSGAACDPAFVVSRRYVRMRADGRDLSGLCGIEKVIHSEGGWAAAVTSPMNGAEYDSFKNTLPSEMSILSEMRVL